MGNVQSSSEALATSSEVAAFLQVPVRTLDHWAYTSTGPKFFKVGRFRRYRMADVEAWLAQQQSA